MKTLRLTLALLASITATSLAKSDVDVYLLKATDVTITEDAITITGSAITRVKTLSDHDDPNYNGFTIYGRNADSTHIKSDDATFTIKKPASDVPSTFWPDCVANAKKLKAGEPVGRIGYYSPEVTIQSGLITAITGSGHLYQSPQSDPPIGAAPKPADTPAWGGIWWTKFANGINQRNVMRETTTRGGHAHGWSSEGKLDHDNDRIIVTYDDGRLERWTPVGHRMVVEHWHPASGYPDSKPIVGIADRTSWDTSR